jgi:hypothetical protein
VLKSSRKSVQEKEQLLTRDPTLRVDPRNTNAGQSFPLSSVATTPGSRLYSAPQQQRQEGGRQDFFSRDRYNGNSRSGNRNHEATPFSNGSHARTPAMLQLQAAPLRDNNIAVRPPTMSHPNNIHDMNMYFNGGGINNRNHAQTHQPVYTYPIGPLSNF